MFVGKKIEVQLFGGTILSAARAGLFPSSVSPLHPRQARRLEETYTLRATPLGGYGVCLSANY